MFCEKIVVRMKNVKYRGKDENPRLKFRGSKIRGKNPNYAVKKSAGGGKLGPTYKSVPYEVQKRILKPGYLWGVFRGCDVLYGGSAMCVTKCDRGRGSKLVKNSVTYFMDGPLVLNFLSFVYNTIQLLFDRACITKFRSVY